MNQTRVQQAMPTIGTQGLLAPRRATSWRARWTPIRCGPQGGVPRWRVGHRDHLHPALIGGRVGLVLALSGAWGTLHGLLGPVCATDGRARAGGGHARPLAARPGRPVCEPAVHGARRGGRGCRSARPGVRRHLHPALGAECDVRVIDGNGDPPRRPGRVSPST